MMMMMMMFAFHFFAQVPVGSTMFPSLCELLSFVYVFCCLGCSGRVALVTTAELMGLPILRLPGRQPLSLCPFRALHELSTGLFAWSKDTS